MANSKDPDQIADLNAENGNKCKPRSDCLERMANRVDPDQIAETGK